jgi:hypothetical protein
MNRLARAAGESCCLAKRTRIGKTDVRGKFTRDLITKPYAAIEIGQSRSNPPSTICLTVETIHTQSKRSNQGRRKPHQQRTAERSDKYPEVGYRHAHQEIAAAGF